MDVVAPEARELEGLGLEASVAEALAVALREAVAQQEPREAWRRLSKEILRPSMPFAIHERAHQAIFAGYPERAGPAPAWIPSAEEIAASNLGKVMDGDYARYHRRSVGDPETHWRAMNERLGIVFEVPPRQILDDGAGAEAAQWLPGAQLNIAASVFDGRDLERVAVVSQSEGGSLERRSLGSLRSDAMQVAAALAARGLQPGDAIAIDMPMTYHAVAIYLGIVLFGGVVVSIADSFAAGEIAVRLKIADAKAIFTQDVICRGDKRLPLFERVVAANAPKAIVLSAGAKLAVTLRPDDLSWQAFLASAPQRQLQDYCVASADAATNILFSSGTTGEPKAIAWTHLTPIKAAADAWAHHDIRQGDVVAWPTNLGWMMGPWLIYAALLNDATIALYEGSPLSADFGRFVEASGVTMLGVVPSLVRAWRQSGAINDSDWSGIRAFSSTGEASSSRDMLWLMSRAGYKPVIEYCGGTEIGGGYLTATVVQAQAPATFSTAALGCDFVLIDDAGQAAELGELALLPPLLGSSQKLLNRDHHEVYYEGMPAGPAGQVLRRHGDQMEHLGGGYYRAHGRVDDTMNLGGIKTSSAEIERACSGAAGILETAAIAVAPPEGGPDRLIVVAVTRREQAASSLIKVFQQRIREALNPLFKVYSVVFVAALPRTASGKVMRRILRDEYLKAQALGQPMN